MFCFLLCFHWIILICEIYWNCIFFFRRPCKQIQTQTLMILMETNQWHFRRGVFHTVPAWMPVSGVQLTICIGWVKNQAFSLMISPINPKISQKYSCAICVLVMSVKRCTARPSKYPEALRIVRKPSVYVSPFEECFCAAKRVSTETEIDLFPNRWSSTSWHGSYE